MIEDKIASDRLDIMPSEFAESLIFSTSQEQASAHPRYEYLAPSVDASEDTGQGLSLSCEISPQLDEYTTPQLVHSPTTTTMRSASPRFSLDEWIRGVSPGSTVQADRPMTSFGDDSVITLYQDPDGPLQVPPNAHIFPPHIPFVLPQVGKCQFHTDCNC